MSLFPTQDKKQFIRITYTRYRNLATRVERKKLGRLPFSLQNMRAWVLAGNASRGKYDCTIRCRYCYRIVTLAESDIDHAIPISRGGSLGLDNMELICSTCNDRKGSMNPTEYLALLRFLERELSLAMSDVLKRLGIANQLAAGAANNRKNKGVESGKNNKKYGVPQA